MVSNGIAGLFGLHKLEVASKYPGYCVTAMRFKLSFSGKHQESGHETTDTALVALCREKSCTFP